MESNELVPTSAPLSPSDVVRQVALIQQVMGEVMKDGEHYGKIPGCGDKPTLLQPGAQVLALTFRLAPEFEVDDRDLPDGHREFIVRCRLISIASGQLVGMGMGLASTMESKWRFRSGPVEFTGTPVPREYWDIRKENPAEALRLIGGKGHQTKKNPDTGSWEIVRAGEKVENDNPADTFNTALKIACKRAFVHAVINATAASDMFTQDIEDATEESLAESIVPMVSDITLRDIRNLRDELKVSRATFTRQLEFYGVTADTSLTQADGERLLATYKARIAKANPKKAGEPS